MKTKGLIGGSVLVVFLFFLFAPGLNSAEKKVSKSDPFSFLQKPVAFLTSFLPIFGPSLTAGTTKTTPSNSSGKVKPTGDSTAWRPSGGD